MKSKHGKLFPNIERRISIENIGISSVAPITIIAYLIGECVKIIPINNKWIPIICGCSGGLLGILANQIMPNYPATDYITALAIGISSGFAATGINEAVKQLEVSDFNDN